MPARVVLLMGAQKQIHFYETHCDSFTKILPVVRHAFERAAYERLGVRGISTITYDQALYGGSPRHNNLAGERGNTLRDWMFETGVYAEEIPLNSVRAAVAHVEQRVREIDEKKLRETLSRVVAKEGD